MATTKNYQIQQKLQNGMLVLHPETNATVVNIDSSNAGVTASNVQGAIKELNDNIKAITGGGVVIGVKGSAETEYRQGKVNITKANIGLGNVDNTSDANKPISTATQNALDKKANTSDLGAIATKDSLTKTDVGLGNVTNEAQIPLSQKGANNGVATLGNDGKIPSSQLPSYVDDVLEYDSYSAFPTSGESGKIYIALDTNLTYRWGGTSYFIISQSLSLGETSSTAYPGDKGKENADAISALQTRATNIETKNTNQDTSIKNAQDSADEAQETADSALQKANYNASAITNITNGTTKVNSATNADKATSAGKLTTAVDISISGDASGTVSFDGSKDVDIAVSLKNSVVTAGTYSVVSVNAKGLVTGGAQMIEVGGTGVTSPSSSLAVGGLFFKEL